MSNKIPSHIMGKIWNEKRRKALAWGLSVFFLFLVLSVTIGVIDHFDTVEEQARRCLEKSPDVLRRIGAPEKVNLRKRFYFTESQSEDGVYREYLYVVRGASGQASFFVGIDRKNRCHIKEVK